MPRLPPVEESDAPELAELVSRIKSGRGGKLLLLYKVLLNSPPVAEGWLALLTAVRQKAMVHGTILDRIILRIAALNGAVYEFEAHRPFALAAGVPAHWIDALEGESLPADLPETERAVLDYTDAMTVRARVDEEIYGRLAGLMETREVLEVTVTVAAYNMVSRVLNAPWIEHEDPAPSGSTA